MGIEPTPSAWKAEVLPLNYARLKFLEGVGFEPTKAEPADLQSAPFDRSGTPPKNLIILYWHLLLSNLRRFLLKAGRTDLRLFAGSKLPITYVIRLTGLNFRLPDGTGTKIPILSTVCKSIVQKKCLIFSP